jgi:hypothetical protein
MRRFILTVAASATALGFAVPAAAQWAPPERNYQPYDHGYGFNVRSLQDRVERIRGEIREMQERRVLSWREARSLENEASRVQDRIFRASGNGIQPGEARRLENDIRRLEYGVSREANDRDDRRDYRRY